MKHAWYVLSLILVLAACSQSDNNLGAATESAEDRMLREVGCKVTETTTEISASEYYAGSKDQYGFPRIPWDAYNYKYTQTNTQVQCDPFVSNQGNSAPEKALPAVFDTQSYLWAKESYEFHNNRLKALQTYEQSYAPSNRRDVVKKLIPKLSETVKSLETFQRQWRSEAETGLNSFRKVLPKLKKLYEDHQAVVQKAEAMGLKRDSEGLPQIEEMTDVLAQENGRRILGELYKTSEQLFAAIREVDEDKRVAVFALLRSGEEFSEELPDDENALVDAINNLPWNRAKSTFEEASKDLQNEAFFASFVNRVDWHLENFALRALYLQVYCKLRKLGAWPHFISDKRAILNPLAFDGLNDEDLVNLAGMMRVMADVSKQMLAARQSPFEQGELAQIMSKEEIEKAERFFSRIVTLLDEKVEGRTTLEVFAIASDIKDFAKIVSSEKPTNDTIVLIYLWNKAGFEKLSGVTEEKLNEAYDLPFQEKDLRFLVRRHRSILEPVEFSTELESELKKAEELLNRLEKEEQKKAPQFLLEPPVTL